MTDANRYDGLPLFERQQHCRDREEWLEARRRGIGGSDAAAALGVSPWMSPLELWLEKTAGYGPRTKDDDERMRWGHLLEPAIRQEFARRTMRTVEHVGDWAITWSNRHAFACCTLDGAQMAADKPGVGVLQIKCLDAWIARDWGDEPPSHYQIQVQHEIMVADVKWGTLAVLVGGNTLRWWDYKRDDELIEDIVALEREFWIDNVEAGVPPEADGTKSSTRALKRMYNPRESSKLELTGDRGHDVAKAVRSLAKAKERLKAAEAAKTKAENYIKEAMRDSGVAVLNDGTIITHKESKNGRRLLRVKGMPDGD